MILVDTSVRIDHLRQAEPASVDAVEAGRVAIHPFVVGEVPCGNLKHRDQVLALLRALPEVPVATHDEALLFIERKASDVRGCVASGYRTRIDELKDR